MLRGRVTAVGGAGLQGVHVDVADHPEFGFTLTDSDGAYNMVVNGGAPLTLEFDLDGFISAQRTQDVPWQMYTQVDDVVLKAFDSKVTTIDHDSTAPIQVASGNPVTDADGTRQATMMFRQGTDATMHLPNGSTQPLDDLQVRATEFTVGPSGDEAMPGELPPSSTYTYAVEFSIDQAVQADATDVTFSKPVATYVDNFLALPRGHDRAGGVLRRGEGRLGSVGERRRAQDRRQARRRCRGRRHRRRRRRHGRRARQVGDHRDELQELGDALSRRRRASGASPSSTSRRGT